jgi:hypothetical protein
LPTLRDAVEHPLETLAALPRRGDAARIQGEIAASLLAAAESESPEAAATEAPPTLPAWDRCTPAQQEELRRYKRRQARLYCRSKPLRGLKAEDRVHEARTARAIGLGDDVRRARDRADWWLAFESSRYAADLDTTQRHPATGMTKREAIEKLVRILGACYRPDNMTSAPGHAYLAQRLGVMHRTITRYVRELEAAGFLEALSAGRSAGQPGTNGAALRVVYLLTVPQDGNVARVANRPVFPTITARLRAAVEKPVTPSEPSELDRTHVRARERRPDGTTTLLGPEDTPTGCFGRSLPADHPGFTRTTRLGPRRLNRDHRTEVADDLLAQVPGLRELRGLSHRAVGAAIRDFVDADYTVDDLAHMLTWLPNNEPRPHSGLYGIERPINWIAHAFDPWRGADGRPVESRSARLLRIGHRKNSSS